MAPATAELMAAYVNGLALPMPCVAEMLHPAAALGDL